MRVLFAVPLLLSAFLANENSASKRSADGSLISRLVRSQSTGAFKVKMLVGNGDHARYAPDSPNYRGCLQDVAWGLVGQHQRFGNTFFHMPPIEPWAIGGSMLCVVLVVLSIRPGSSQESARFMGRSSSALSSLLSGVLLANDVLRPLQHGLEPRGASVLLFAHCRLCHF